MTSKPKLTRFTCLTGEGKNKHISDVSFVTLQFHGMHNLSRVLCQSS